MALATRCPHCQTAFRVASDQLKLRAGLVRCGTCKQIFNGIENLLRPDEDITAILAGATPPLPPVPVLSPPSFPPAPAATRRDDRSDNTRFNDLIAEIDHPGPQQHADAQPESTNESSPAPGAAGYAAKYAPVHLTPLPGTPDSSGIPPAQWPGLSASRIVPQPSTAADIAPERVPDGRIEPQLFGSPLSVPPGMTNELADSPSGTAGADNGATSNETGASSESLWLALDDDTAWPREPQLLDADMRTMSAAAAEQSTQTDADATVAEAATVGTATMPGLLRAARIDPTDQPPPKPPAPAPEPAPEEVPGFIAREQRRQNTHRAVRPALWTGAVLLALALAGQTIYALRTTLAANIPQLRASLDDACRMIGCSVGLPMQIEAVSIESNDFQPVAGSRNLFLLTMLLRNRGSTLQAWPSVELSLNDGTEKVVGRRVIAPREYLPPTLSTNKGFATGSEQAIKLYFDLTQLKAVGYRVYLFYP